MSEGSARGRGRPWKRFMAASGVSVCVLLLLCWKTQTKLTDVGAKLLDVDVFLLGVTFAVSGAVHIFAGAYKWLLILRGMGCDTTYGEALFVRMGSDPIRIVAPFKTGELSNIAYFWRRGKLTFAQSASWILLDKVLNIAGTCFWMVVGLAMVWGAGREMGVDQRVVLAGAGFAAVMAGGGALLMFCATARRAVRRACARIHSRLGRIMEQLLFAFEEISARRKALLVVFGMGFQLRPLIVCWLLTAAFRADFAALPSVGALLAWGSVVVVCGNVPYLQWGTGAREWALVAVFSHCLATPDNPQALIAVGILMAVAIHIVPAVIGLPVLGSFLAVLGGRGGPDDAVPEGAPGDEQ